MEVLKTFLFTIIVLASGCLGATKTKCQVVAALRAAGVPDTDLRDWLCLVGHESSFRYNATNRNRNRSVDYGIFQLNNRYWCDRPGTSSNVCWRFRTYGCEDSCSSFVDSDITNDASCAVRIKNCNGFQPWYGWRRHCQRRTNWSNYNYSGC